MEKRTTILSEGAVADLTGCGKSLNRDDSPPQGLKPSLILHDLRGAKAPLYHSAAGFRDFFRSLLDRGGEIAMIISSSRIAPDVRNTHREWLAAYDLEKGFSDWKSRRSRPT